MEEGKPKKGVLRKTFNGAGHVLKELTIHSMIHFTVWGAIFASNFAVFLTPIFDPLGNMLTAGAGAVGLEHLFTEAAGGGGVTTLDNSPDLSSLPELDIG